MADAAASYQPTLQPKKKPVFEVYPPGKNFIHRLTTGLVDKLFFERKVYEQKNLKQKKEKAYEQKEQECEKSIFS